MKLFRRKVQEKQTVKVDPRSHKFVDTIKVLLEDQGMTNPRAVNECTHQLLKTSQRFYKGLKVEDEDYNPEDIVALETNFRTILMRHGIPEEEKQDEIFIGFFGTLNELGAEGLK